MLFGKLQYDCFLSPPPELLPHPGCFVRYGVQKMVGLESGSDNLQGQFHHKDGFLRCKNIYRKFTSWASRKSQKLASETAALSHLSAQWLTLGPLQTLVIVEPVFCLQI